VHYRTRRSFAANLSVLASVNAALGGVLTDMRASMGHIDVDLERVRANLRRMEDAYEGVFLRANRLITGYTMGKEYPPEEALP